MTDLKKFSFTLSRPECQFLYCPHHIVMLPFRGSARMTDLQESNMSNDEIKAKLVKIIGVYYAESDDARKAIGGTFATRLVLELEDGRLLRAQSTDPIMAFEEIGDD